MSKHLARSDSAHKRERATKLAQAYRDTGIAEPEASRRASAQTQKAAGGGKRAGGGRGKAGDKVTYRQRKDRRAGSGGSPATAQKPARRAASGRKRADR